VTAPANTRQDRSASLRELRKAARRREKAVETRRRATDDLAEWCRRAQAAGVSVTEIASAAGLSRQGVYDLLGDRQPS